MSNKPFQVAIVARLFTRGTLVVTVGNLFPGVKAERRFYFGRWPLGGFIAAVYMGGIKVRYS